MSPRAAKTEPKAKLAMIFDVMKEQGFQGYPQINRAVGKIPFPAGLFETILGMRSNLPRFGRRAVLKRAIPLLPLPAPQFLT